MRRLVDDGVLSADQADAVGRALHVEPFPAGRRIPPASWAEVAGYVGGGLVLAGAIVVLASSWDELTVVTRTVVVGAFTLLLLGAGVLASGGVGALVSRRARPLTARLRVAGALLALGAAGTSVAVGVALSGDLSSDESAWRLAAAAGAGLVVAVVGYALLSTGFGLVAVTVAALATVTFTTEATVGATPLRTGLVMVAVGVALGALALSGVVEQSSLGIGLGAGIALYGAQQPIGADETRVWAYLLTLALAGTCLAVYHWKRSWVLLVFGVIGMTLGVPEAVWDLTGGALGGAAILVIAGTVLLAASWYGFWLQRHGSGSSGLAPPRPTGERRRPARDHRREQR